MDNRGKSLARLFPLSSQASSLLPPAAISWAASHIDPSLSYSEISLICKFIVSQNENFCSPSSYSTLTRSSHILIDCVGFVGFNSLAFASEKTPYQQIYAYEAEEQYAAVSYKIFNQHKLNSHIIQKQYSFFKKAFPKKYDEQTPAAVLFWDLDLPIDQKTVIKLNAQKDDLEFSPPLGEWKTLSSLVAFTFSQTTCTMMVLKLPIVFNPHLLRPLVANCTEQRKISTKYLVLSLCGKLGASDDLTALSSSANNGATDAASSKASPSSSFPSSEVTNKNEYNDDSVVPAFSFYQLQTMASFVKSGDKEEQNLYRRLKQLFASRLHGCERAQRLLFDHFCKLVGKRRPKLSEEEEDKRKKALLPSVSHFGDLLTDEEIYDELREYYHSYIVELPEVREMKKNDDSSIRSNSRVTEIDNILKSESSTVINWQHSKLLDLGCSEGAITSSLVDHFQAPRRNIHGCDVREVGTKGKFTFTLLSDPLRLPYPDSHFDYVIALMALHHIPTLSNSLNEVFRVLKPGGLFIIREHDCTPKRLAIVIDIMHGLYTRVWSDPPEQPHFCHDYYAHYRTREEWTTILEETGFAQSLNSPDRDGIYVKPEAISISRHNRMIKNPFGYYYGTYRKPQTAKRKIDTLEELESNKFRKATVNGDEKTASIDASNRKTEEIEETESSRIQQVNTNNDESQEKL